MVRPVDGSSSSEFRSSTDETSSSKGDSKTAVKIAGYALSVFVVGPVEAFKTTVVLFKKDALKRDFMIWGSVLAVSLVVLPLALIVSSSALPVIAALAFIIGSVTIGVGVFALGKILINVFAIAATSMVMGGIAAEKGIRNTYNY